ncbi:hypothetical protein ACIGHG_25520, partial [Bacillus sp. NPDC077411]|uniref:hypothetical protein n=1 Tax=Bacillus sp. NPDC077411 TaxID=3363947 RepID=UPI0037C576B4
VVPEKSAIVEHEVKGLYILDMTNMYSPLFFMNFYNLGLDNFIQETFLFQTIIPYFSSSETCKLAEQIKISQFPTLLVTSVFSFSLASSKEQAEIMVDCESGLTISFRENCTLRTTNPYHYSVF